MKKLIAVIGVFGILVLALAIYNRMPKTVTVSQPMSAEPTVSAPETSSVIVASGNVTPVYK